MKKVSILLIAFILLLSYFSASFALSKIGSSGEEVRKIQTKLKSWGYYKGNVDGIYGSKTYQAVRNFQKNNKLTVDGIAGKKTLAAMGISDSSNSNKTLNNNTDVNLLGKLVYAEARGEPYNGMVAVAAIVLNRVSSSKFPNTISGVIYQSGAFTCVQDGQINLTANEQSKKAAQDAINGWDPTSGCIYYFNPKTATSSWIWSRPQVIQIGKHIFCK